MTTQPATHTSGEPLLVRIADAARMLSLGRSTIYEMVARGEIPSVKCGAARRIPLAAIYRWIEDNTKHGA